MRVATDPAFFQGIVDHPRVWPAISMAGQREIDVGALWPACIGLEFDTGGWLFHRVDMGVYEAHTLFLPKSRDVRSKAAQALTHMFTATDCREVVGRIPDDLPHALALAKAAGLRVRFRMDAAWPRHDGLVGVTYLGLTIDEWACHVAAAGTSDKIAVEKSSWH
jgi:hypothetical protein